MPFTLRNVGAGCYALAFRGEHIGSAFALDDEALPWMVKIHDSWAAHTALPAPFQTRQHRFHTLQDLRNWLRGAKNGAVVDNAGMTLS